MRNLMPLTRRRADVVESKPSQYGTQGGTSVV